MREEIIGDCRLILGDCRDVLPELWVFDLLLTDPPYGLDMGKAKNNSGGKYGKQSGESHIESDWDSEVPPPELLNLMVSKAKNSVLWGGNYFCKELSNQRGWFVWDKMNDDFYSTSDCELAWTNFNQRLKIFRRSHGLDKGFMVKDGWGNVHPTQKPIPLMEWCITQAKSNPQTVLDPFMGSGTTGVACVNLGRKFTGIEREPKYFDIACKRIDDAYRQTRMFA